jgi:putative transposase
MREHAKSEVVWTHWPHGPTHLFMPEGFYIVTVSTYLKERIFNTPERLTLVLSTLFEQAERFGWMFQAWAVMQNHYHFVAQAPQNVKSLRTMLRAVHSKTAKAVNAEDGSPGRQVWYQYRDTCLTNEKSYFARLHYVHINPVKHGLVAAAEDYQWCSMGWLLQKANPAFRQTVLSFPCDRISIEDDF